MLLLTNCNQLLFNLLLTCNSWMLISNQFSPSLLLFVLVQNSIQCIYHDSITTVTLKVVSLSEIIKYANNFQFLGNFKLPSGSVRLGYNVT